MIHGKKNFVLLRKYLEDYLETSSTLKRNFKRIAKRIIEQKHFTISSYLTRHPLRNKLERRRQWPALKSHLNSWGKTNQIKTPLRIVKYNRNPGYNNIVLTNILSHNDKVYLWFHFGTKLIPSSSFFRSKKTSTLMNKIGIINFRVGTKALQTNTIEKKKRNPVTRFSRAM